MGASGLLHPKAKDVIGIAQALSQKARAFSTPQYQLKNLMAHPQRFSDFSQGISGFFMDYSRQRLDQGVMDLLYELASATGALERFDQMVGGATVNPSEGRAALHTAARGTGPEQIRVHGEDAVAAIGGVNQRIQAFCQAVHGAKITAKDRKPFTHAVVVGIGGSYLGCEFVYQAMGAGIKPKIPLFFLPNVDIDDFAQVITAIQPETTLWIIISKSFTTTETLANYALISAWIKAQGLDPADNLVTVTAKGSPGDGANTQVLESFHMFDFIGGRYSVSSAVGGLPLSLAFGFEAFQGFLTGCRDMDMHTLSSERSLPMTAALISIWNSRFLGYPAQGIIPYSSRLARLPAHVQQLHMESLGKSATQDGEALLAPSGIIIFGEPGTNAQHSFFQLAHQGPGFPMEFIGVLRPGFSGPQTLSKGVTNHQELWANLLAQAQALALGRDHEDPARRFEGNRPSTLISLDSLAPETIGKLLSFYEARTVLEGFILGVNPFDQFGVELGKTMAGEIRKEMALRNQNPAHRPEGKDPSLGFFLNALFEKLDQR